MKYSHDNRWSLHMAQMALQLDNYKHNFNKGAPRYGCESKEHIRRARERVELYVNSKYFRAPVHYDEVDDSSKWAIY